MVVEKNIPLSGGLVKGVEDNFAGDDLREHDGLAAWRIDDVTGDAGAAEFAQEGSDVGVAAGPVGLQEDDPALAEGILHLGTVEDEVLVYLAIDTPVGGKIDEDDPVLGERVR